MDCATYCRACYSSKHKTLKYRNLKEDNDSSRAETGTTRPASRWKETIVGRRHTKGIATLQPSQAVNAHQELLRTASVVMGTKCVMSQLRAQGQIVCIRLPRLTVRPTSRSTRGIQPPSSTPSQSIENCGYRNDGLWMQKVPHQG